MVWKKEKMLVTSNVSFSSSVFKGLVTQTHEIKVFFGKGLCNPFPYKPWFLHVCRTSHLKTLWINKKMLVISSFSSSTMFSTLLENFLPFSSNQKLSSANSFSLEGSKKLLFWEWVKLGLTEILQHFFTHLVILPITNCTLATKKQLT